MAKQTNRGKRSVLNETHKFTKDETAIYSWANLVPLILKTYNFKVRICSLQYLIFQRLLDLNNSPLSTLNEANLTSATQTLNFYPTMHYRAKTSQPDGKIRN